MRGEERGAAQTDTAPLPDLRAFRRLRLRRHDGSCPKKPKLCEAESPINSRDGPDVRVQSCNRYIAVGAQHDWDAKSGDRGDELLPARRPKTVQSAGEIAVLAELGLEMKDIGEPDGMEP